jgi:CrcB protein
VILAACVALGGAIGAPARFTLDGWLQRRAQSSVPVGTLAVNLTGAFTLGIVVGLLDAHPLDASVGTVLSAGFLGGLTTFSTFTFESVRLAEESAWRPLATYLAVTLAGGVLAAALGLWLAAQT